MRLRAGRNPGNVEKDQLCLREEFRVWVVDMLHAVPLLYSVMERSPCLYLKQVKGNKLLHRIILYF